jgi:hypothetical protein
VLSLGLIAVAWVAARVPFDLYPAHNFWKTNPAMFFVRVGAVSIFTSLVFLAEQSIQSIPRIPSIIGKESLFIYILHLVILYGSVFAGPNLGNTSLLYSMPNVAMSQKNSYVGRRWRPVQSTPKVNLWRMLWVY